MTGRLPEAFMTQAIACEALGSPLTSTLLKLLAARLQPNNPLTVRLFNWPGDMGPDAESVPLRLAGALNSLRILGRCGLEEAYENYDTDPDALWHAVDRALTEEAPFISTFIDSAPQTNDVRRASVLIAVSHWLTQRFKRPLDIYEVGASAGLNLMWDKFALYLGENVYGDEDSPVRLAPEWTGPYPPLVEPKVRMRRGVDLNPIDIQNPIDRLRLKSYIWPDQFERVGLTDAAIGLSDVIVEQGDAVDWLNSTLQTASGALSLVYSTVAWQYLSSDAQERGRSIIETVGRAATEDSPLAWFQMEADGQNGSAAMTLRLWPGELRFNMGRVDFHGRWVKWTPPV